MAAPVSGMKKTELREELDRLGVEYSSKDNVPILSELLKESRAKGGVRSKADLRRDDETRGLTGLNKQALLERAEAMGLRQTPNMTRNFLITAITTAILDRQVPTGEDILNIGKHQGCMYQTLRDTQPGYLNWVRECVADGTAHPEFRRLVRWLDLKVAACTAERPPDRQTNAVWVPKAKSEPRHLLPAQPKAASAKPSDSTEQASGSKRSPPVETPTMTVDASNRPEDSTHQLLKSLMQRMENMEHRANALQTPIPQSPRDSSQSSGVGLGTQRTLSGWIKAEQ